MILEADGNVVAITNSDYGFGCINNKTKSFILHDVLICLAKLVHQKPVLCYPVRVWR